jgi:hypothetical protein
MPFFMALGAMTALLPLEFKLGHRFCFYAKAACLFLLITVLRINMSPALPMLLTALGIILLNNFSTRKALQMLPHNLSHSVQKRILWSLLKRTGMSNGQLPLGNEYVFALVPGKRQMEQQVLGWPLAALQTRSDSIPLQTNDVLLLSLFVGWSVAFLPSNAFSSAETAGVERFLYAPALVRLLIYALALRPPISFIGRILSGWWFIPRYDRILVAPALSALGGWAVFSALTQVGATDNWILAGGMTVAVACALGLGPSLSTQRLAGAHTLLLHPFTQQALRR